MDVLEKVTSSIVKSYVSTLTPKEKVSKLNYSWLVSNVING